MMNLEISLAQDSIMPLYLPIYSNFHTVLAIFIFALLIIFTFNFAKFIKTKRNASIKYASRCASLISRCSNISLFIGATFFLQGLIYGGGDVLCNSTNINLKSAAIIISFYPLINGLIVFTAGKIIFYFVDFLLVCYGNNTPEQTR